MGSDQRRPRLLADSARIQNEIAALVAELREYTRELEAENQTDPSSVVGDQHDRPADG